MRRIARKIALVFTVPVSLAVLYAVTSGCESALGQRPSLADSEPTRLLLIYAAFVGVTFSILLAFSGRGLWWSVVDSVCSVGLLSFAAAPIYWTANDDWRVALAIGLSGLCAVTGTTVLYWLAKKMPAKQPVFQSEPGDEKEYR